MPRPNFVKHPFPVLLYLEWTLLGIAALTAFPPPFLPRRSRFLRGAGPIVDAEPFVLGVFLCIGALGLLGLRLPIAQSRTAKALYTLLGFGISWLATFWGGQGGNSFSAMLLVVVIRSCLLFPWRGRSVVAGAAFGAYVLRLLMGLRQFYNSSLGNPERTAPLRPLRRWTAEQAQAAVLNLTLNSALMFGLVLIFVLLMVGTILSERQSRDRLELANDRLRRYALLAENQAILQERTRIARDIHDSVGHTLTAQSIQLENVALWVPQDLVRATDHLAKARSLGKEALKNVRQSVASLHQQPLQGQSLPNALEKLIDEFGRTTNIQIQRTVQLHRSPPTEQAIALYRIVQEALTNIAKHSHATQVQIRLAEQSTRIELEIQDNGQGFDPALNTTGFGLQSMRERTEALDGTFEITRPKQAHPQAQGCRIHLTLPKTGGQV
ncbi:MAG: sensor histidine kinase [Thermosynechococcaceae cyanobacterium MS004]|nr:sensor histidine kinase [Thermosynechococcaceae cyanobacterium MS004]